MRVTSLVLIAISALCSCVEVPGESQTRQYPTRADAERNGAFVRGWLPADIPADATDIVESHNLDSNQVWIGHKLSGPIPEDLLQRCVVDRDVPLPPARQTLRTAAWWPEALTSGKGSSQPIPGRVYRCSALGREPSVRPYALLIDEIGQQVWYWSIPEEAKE